MVDDFYASLDCQETIEKSSQFPKKPKEENSNNAYSSSSLSMRMIRKDLSRFATVEGMLGLLLEEGKFATTDQCVKVLRSAMQPKRRHDGLQVLLYSHSE